MKNKVEFILILSFLILSSSASWLPFLDKATGVFKDISEAVKYKKLYKLTPMYILPKYSKRINRIKNDLVDRGCKI